MTRQRQAVLSVVSRKGYHYTAEEVFFEAKQILPEISRATVYNSLHVFEKEKLIRRITAEDSKDRYDSSYIPHGHLFCTRCGAVSDFEIPNFAEKLNEILKTQLESYELKVRHICDKCKQ